jgi:hypothetical protein
MLSAMWIWRRSKCSISLHNQEFYTLARPSNYARKSAQLDKSGVSLLFIDPLQLYVLETFYRILFLLYEITMQL